MNQLLLARAVVRHEAKFPMDALREALGIPENAIVAASDEGLFIRWETTGLDVPAAPAEVAVPIAPVAPTRGKGKAAAPAVEPTPQPNPQPAPVAVDDTP